MSLTLWKQSADNEKLHSELVVRYSSCCFICCMCNINCLILCSMSLLYISKSGSDLMQKLTNAKHLKK